ncbi:cysteine proteinase mucunain-like [Prosopis cineraria]|uniref:cysteine proteinase mucunain-like n=1 Tax=Prosopis cineraria TaxID=364024 RepID=UPI00240FBAFD|nr:cysteine proteinase mucunain-like [Prosopis cineraria]
MDMSIISNDRAHSDGSNWRTDEEVMDMYDRWLLKQGKVYNGLGEKEKRFQIFKDNLRFIDEQNAENRTYKMGLNKFADLNNDEFVDKHLGITRIDPRRSIAKTKSNCCAPHMEEIDSKMWPELLAKAFIDVMAKTQMSEAIATWAEASKAKAEAYKEKAERYKGEKSNEEATFFLRLFSCQVCDCS